MKKNVIVTGAAGFIGSKIASRLVDLDYKVFGIDDLSNGSEKNVPKKVDFLKFDLSNKKKLNSLPKNCKAILHLAGQSSGEKSFESPQQDLKKNTLSTLNLLSYGVENNVERIIYASSMSVYGDYNKKLKENFNLNPLSCYGVSKLASENYLKLFSKKIPFVSLRMFNVYGPGQNLKDLKQGMVSIYLAYALKKNKILVKGSLNRVRDFIYIDDVVNIWERAIVKKNILNNFYNLGSGVPTSVKKLTQMIRENFKNCKVMQTLGTPGDQNYVCSNNDLLKKHFNYKKFIKLKDGLKKFLKDIL